MNYLNSDFLFNRDWIGRLKLAEHWMDKLCNLTDEV
jgi:hypothetical protein